MSHTFRSKELEQTYREHRKNLPADAGCPLCTEEALEQFVYWKLIANNFPYDSIASTHHMLVPLRHVQEQNLTPEEKAEFFEIKATHLQKYDYLLEGTIRRKSIPSHFHLHLLIGKVTE